MKIEHIPIEKIIPDPDPLRDLDMTVFPDLKDSIAKYGVLQPILVKPVYKKNTILYQVVFGNHRYYAAKGVGLKTLPCIVKQLSVGHAIFLSLQENIQRAEMNPVLQGKAFHKLIESGHVAGLKALATRLRKSETYITNRIKLYLKLHENLVSEIGKTLTLSNALTLCRHSKERQLVIFQNIMSIQKEEAKFPTLTHGYYGGNPNLPIGKTQYCVCPNCGAQHLRGVSIAK